MNSRWIVVAAGLVMLGVGEGRAATEVDLALVLTVDVSRSMDFEEQKLQREGYVNAFRDRDVVNAITDGLTGRIAVTYVEWAATNLQTVVVPWTVIDGPATANAFAAALDGAEIQSWNGTSISGALNFATGLLETSGFNAIRRVIDVSGDGVNNNGLPLGPVHDLVVKKGITINGLPVMLGAGNFFGAGPSSANLDIYYRDCVIGGPDSFLFTISKPEEFATATRRKLIQEIASIPSPAGRGPIPVQQRPASNCF
ncbi:MAG: DUF1194 domain-containing protein [Bauldia sp.]